VRLSYRSTENILRLTLDQESGVASQHHELDGHIDIAEQGRLVGIELDADAQNLHALFLCWNADPVARQYLEIDESGAYVALSAPSEQISPNHVRTAELTLTLEIDSKGNVVAIAIPRRGDGYEISFPSGNQ
jgi:uncharacterized protein YuzE